MSLVNLAYNKCFIWTYHELNQYGSFEPSQLNEIINILIFAICIFSYSALTLEDEKRTLAALINGFIKMVSDNCVQL